MIEAKFLEIRDRSTCIPALAIKLGIVTFPDTGHREAALTEAWLLATTGFATTGFDPDDDYILIIKLVSMEVQYDPYSWGRVSRTMEIAHKWVLDNWNDVASGQVVDVRFITGEASEPARSDRENYGPAAVGEDFS